MTIKATTAHTSLCNTATTHIVLRRCLKVSVMRITGCEQTAAALAGGPPFAPLVFAKGGGNKGAVPFEPEGEVKSQRLSMSRLVHLTARLNLLPSRAAYLPCCPELHAHRRR
jgi:hypothetical protein